jgi:hypothetical protein
MMISAMNNVAPDDPPKRPRVPSSSFSGNNKLEQFCTVNSNWLFSLLVIPENGFLSKDPSEWDEDDSFKEALHAVKSLAVVIDKAKRDVTPIQDFNKKMKREDQLQFLLQVVMDHRRKFPNCTKKTIMAKKENNDKIYE